MINFSKVSDLGNQQLKMKWKHIMNLKKLFNRRSSMNTNRIKSVIIGQTATENKKHDDVNNPSHYTDSRIEVIDYIEDKKLGFCLGNAIKYISRAGKKKDNGRDIIDKEIEDLQKAIWYINRRIFELKKEVV